MSDQVNGMIMDSDIKFECRLMLEALKHLNSDGLNEIFLPMINNIVKLENERLKAL